MAESDHIQVIKNEEGLHGIVGMVRGHSIHGRLRSVTGVIHHRMTPLDSLPLDEAAKLAGLTSKYLIRCRGRRRIANKFSSKPFNKMQDLAQKSYQVPQYFLAFWLHL